MDRRSFLTVMGAAMSAPAHQWLLAEPVPYLTRSGKSRRVTLNAVDELDLMNASLRRLDDGGGGDRLLLMVRAHVRQVVQLIDHSSYTDTVGRRLHSNAGELLRLAGWLAFDGGQHAGAQRYWMAALRAAHTAGDRALAANTLGFMSCQAKDIKQPLEAVTLAESARAGYRGASPRVSAILRCARRKHMPPADQQTELAAPSMTLSVALTHRRRRRRTGATGSIPDTHMAKPDSATSNSATIPQRAGTSVKHCVCKIQTPPAKGPCATPCSPPPMCAKPIPTSTRRFLSPIRPSRSSPTTSARTAVSGT